MEKQTIVGWTLRVTPEREDVLVKFRELKWLERADWSEILFRAIKEYVEKHYDKGNPQLRLIPKKTVQPTSTLANSIMKGHLSNLLQIISLEPGINLNKLIAEYSVTQGYNKETVKKYIRVLNEAGKIVMKNNKLYAHPDSG